MKFTKTTSCLFALSIGLLMSSCSSSSNSAASALNGSSVPNGASGGSGNSGGSASTTGGSLSIPPPEGAPYVLYTDATSGPSNGGENDKGMYLSIFGINFGGTGLGSTVRVYINDVEVDSYRSLGLARGRTDIGQVTVQVGALGNPTPGKALPIKVVVNGVASNTDQTFTVNPGTIYFVSPTGVDTTDTTSGGTFDAPFRTLQKAGMGLSFSIDPASVSGAYGRVRAGDVIVMRGGHYTDVSLDGYAMEALNKSGCPIGTKCTQGGGTSSGPITIMGYPGEDAFIDRTFSGGASNDGGALSGSDSTRQEEGFGAWYTIANLRIECGFYDGPINVQRGDTNPFGSHWRVINNELTAASCKNAPACRSGGISGNGDGNVWYGNYIHQVYDGPNDGSSDLEMHGIYIGGNGSYDIAYNRFESIYGGSGIQTNNNGDSVINNVNIHHNIVTDVSKHGINIADAIAGVNVYNNVVYNCDYSGIRFNSDSLTGAKIYNNTIYFTDRLNGYAPQRAALLNDGAVSAGAMAIFNNIIVAGNPQRYFVGGNGDFQAVASTMSNNLWFNGTDGNRGTANQTSEPLFVSTTPGAEDLSIKAGSPAIDTGTKSVSTIVNTDYALITRPQGAGYDIGAYEYH